MSDAPPENTATRSFYTNLELFLSEGRAPEQAETRELVLYADEVEQRLNPSGTATHDQAVRPRLRRPALGPWRSRKPSRVLD